LSQLERLQLNFIRITGKRLLPLLLFPIFSLSHSRPLNHPSSPTPTHHCRIHQHHHQHQHRGTTTLLLPTSTMHQLICRHKRSLRITHHTRIPRLLIKHFSAIVSNTQVCVVPYPRYHRGVRMLPWCGRIRPGLRFVWSLEEEGAVPNW